jgi:short subunit dehydrogenase-like uncharacterized protein
MDLRAAMSGRALLYGASGYTGRLVAGRMAAAGVHVVLAGRRAEAVRQVAEPLGLPWTAFELTDSAALDAALAEAEVVLHAAGPFRQTAAPMLAGCLRTRTHYLDLGGEWPVFAEIMARGAEAEAAGIMLMPGVGLTIVATDCLMALAMHQQPDAVKLRVGISRAQVVTRGSVGTAATLFAPGTVVRRGGELVSVPAGSLTHPFDFGDGLREATAMSWADVVTGQLSTGVPDIETYSELPFPQRASYRAAGRVLSRAWPEAPTDAALGEAAFVMVAEALDPWRRPSRVRMRTRDGYTVSMQTATAAVQRVLRGDVVAGFQTPSRVFGADFILGLGCAELDRHRSSSGAAA